MKRDANGLAETLKSLHQTLLEDAGAARDSSLAPLSSDVGELLLAELRARREHIGRLIRLISEEARVNEGFTRASRSNHRCRPAGAGPYGRFHSVH